MFKFFAGTRHSEFINELIENQSYISAEEKAQQMMKEMWTKVAPFVHISKSGNHILNYILETCDDSTFAALLKIVHEQPICNTEAFYTLIENVIREEEDKIKQKVLRLKLLSISTQYIFPASSSESTNKKHGERNQNDDKMHEDA